LFLLDDDRYYYREGKYFEENLSALNYGTGNMMVQLLPVPREVEEHFQKSLIIFERELKLKRVLKKYEKR